MRNDACIIYMTTMGGSTQSFRKTKDGWVQKSGKGRLYRMTAEQVISHILPVLAGKKGVTIRVKHRTEYAEK